jgi:hypothetical protein
MRELLEKISSYNLFNYLFPGVLFAVVADAVTGTQLIQNDLVIGVFIYYFLGAIVSRIGSVLIEPILRRWEFVRFVSYGDFVRASKADPKLEILSETNNMYRTICAVFLLTGGVAAYDMLANALPWLKKAAPAVCIVGLFVLFLMSYRKKSAHITQRINAQLKQ